ncbi:MAG TPA: type II toxin-antitoxin system death-on-curing family toxin [Tepidisphaeraceae bacterium]|jgi:death-on-curing protein
MSPLFLTLAEVIDLHRMGVEQFGGAAEARDMGLLQSALAMPSLQFSGEYLHGDLAAMAAAYLFHILKNHPFVDGNKRAGAMTARVFLLMNDVTFDPPEDEYGDLVLGVAAGEISKEQATEFFRKHVR